MMQLNYSATVFSITSFISLPFSFTSYTKSDEAQLEKILQDLIEQNEELEVFNMKSHFFN